VFVETGTLFGDAVDFISKYDFEEMHSIEIIKDLADKASLRFSSNDKIQIHNGHSADILKVILSPIKENVLFWLDAHFPGVDSRHSDISTTIDIDIKIPLKKELEIIVQRAPIFKDVIIIDDLWVYEDCPCESGLFNVHMKKYGFNITRQELGTNGIQFIIDMFEKTHTIARDFRHQGYIIITPKDSK
jgi:hypothetical protein